MSSDPRSDPRIEPDGKDWTWVLEQPCPECGFDPAAIDVTDLPDLIRFALGSGMRVGELCAVRWMDLNLDGIPLVTANDMRLVPIVAVTGNLVYIKGKGLALDKHGVKFE